MVEVERDGGRRFGRSVGNLSRQNFMDFECYFYEEKKIQRVQPGNLVAARLKTMLEIWEKCK